MSASKHIVYEKSLIPRSCHPDCCAWSGPESSACSCLGKFLMHTGTSMVGPLGLCRSPRWVGAKAMSRVNDIAQSKTFADRRNRPGRFQGGSRNGPPVKHLKFKQCNQEWKGSQTCPKQSTWVSGLRGKWEGSGMLSKGVPPWSTTPDQSRFCKICPRNHHLALLMERYQKSQELGVPLYSSHLTHTSSQHQWDSNLQVQAVQGSIQSLLKETGQWWED